MTITSWPVWSPPPPDFPDLPLPLLPDLLSFLAPCSCHFSSPVFADARNRSRRDAPLACGVIVDDTVAVLSAAIMAAFAALVVKGQKAAATIAKANLLMVSCDGMLTNSTRS